MKNNNQEITHKELLTFSNLTNLEWEFTEIKVDSDDGDEARDEDQSQYKPLVDLLTPEEFAIRDEEGEVERYIYGEDEYGNHEEEKGLIQMRQKAGIAMEYLEKDEGDFLKEWEVIYGADKYKIIEDYLDQRWVSVMKKHLKPEDFKLDVLGLTEKDFNSVKDYNDYAYEEEYKKYVELANKPTREDHEEMFERKARIEFIANILNPAIRLIAPWFDFSNGLSLMGQANFLEKIAYRMVYHMGGNDNCYRLSFGLLFLLNPYDVSSVLTGVNANKELDPLIKDPGEESDIEKSDIIEELSEKLKEKMDDIQ